MDDMKSCALMWSACLTGVLLLVPPLPTGPGRVGPRRSW
jgi:hypothetical protein